MIGVIFDAWAKLPDCCRQHDIFFAWNLALFSNLYENGSKNAPLLVRWAVALEFVLKAKQTLFCEWKSIYFVLAKTKWTKFCGKIIYYFIRVWYSSVPINKSESRAIIRSISARSDCGRWRKLNKISAILGKSFQCFFFGIKWHEVQFAWKRKPPEVDLVFSQNYLSVL